MAVVTEEGGAAHTINSCKQCENERRLKQGDQPVKAAQWREVKEQKAFRGKLWPFGMEQYLRRMFEHFTVKRALAKAVLSDAEKERQAGIQRQLAKGGRHVKRSQNWSSVDDL